MVAILQKKKNKKEVVKTIRDDSGEKSHIISIVTISDSLLLDEKEGVLLYLFAIKEFKEIIKE